MSGVDDAKRAADAETQAELSFLRFFYQEARKGMGPADCDIYDMIKEDYVEQHGALPAAYLPEDEGEFDGYE